MSVANERPVGDGEAVRFFACAGAGGFMPARLRDLFNSILVRAPVC
jgi:hypothetical protein